MVFLWIGIIAAWGSLSVHHNANQLTTQAGGGKVRITGAINKSGASVAVAGHPAAVHPQGGFAVEVQASPGANHFPLVVTEADGTVTTKHVDLFVENSIPVVHSYDANGNLESVAPQAAPGSPTRTYQWDAANRLVGITRIHSPTETRKSEFFYNGAGARVGKKELLNGVVESDIKYYYGGIGVLQERTADGGTVTKTYTLQGEVDYTTTPSTKRYHTLDHLGSVREVVAEDETLVARYDYKPYGESEWGQASRVHIKKISRTGFCQAVPKPDWNRRFQPPFGWRARPLFLAAPAWRIEWRGFVLSTA